MDMDMVRPSQATTVPFNPAGCIRLYWQTAAITEGSGLIVFACGHLLHVMSLSSPYPSSPPLTSGYGRLNLAHAVPHMDASAPAFNVLFTRPDATPAVTQGANKQVLCFRVVRV